MSRSSAARRSRFRANIATAYPPRAKRREIAAPVPGPTPVTTATGFFLSTSGFLLRLIVHDPSALEPRDIVGLIAKLGEDGRVVRAEQGRKRADCRRRAIEASRRPRHSHLPKRLGLKLFKNLILADLLVLQQFETASDRRWWNIDGEQPRQDLVGAPFLELRRGYRAALDRVYRPVARGLEAGIVDQLLPI